MPNLNTLLDEHVVLKYEFPDRFLLNGYISKLQEPTQLSWFLCQHLCRNTLSVIYETSFAVNPVVGSSMKRASLSTPSWGQVGAPSRRRQRRDPACEACREAPSHALG
jgi:hypothetical protein